MKKILILLIGFAFTQSIQTKQVEVTITDWSEFNLYELLDNPVGGNYKVELNGVDLNGTSSQEMYYEYYIYKIHFFANEDEGVTSFNTIAPIHYDIDSMVTNSDNIPIWSEGQGLIINSQYPIVITGRHDGEPYENFPLNPLTYTFWVTGMFEDEGVGLQGDMNDDEIINVVDIVALVNIIIGEEE